MLVRSREPDLLVYEQNQIPGLVTRGWFWGKQFLYGRAGGSVRQRKWSDKPGHPTAMQATASGLRCFVSVRTITTIALIPKHHASHTQPHSSAFDTAFFYYCTAIVQRTWGIFIMLLWQDGKTHSSRGLTSLVACRLSFNLQNKIRRIR